MIRSRLYWAVVVLLAGSFVSPAAEAGSCSDFWAKLWSGSESVPGVSGNGASAPKAVQDIPRAAPVRQAAAHVPPAGADWRKTFSHPNEAGAFTATGAQREKKVKALVEELDADVKDGVAGAMEVVSAKGVKVKMLLESEGYGSGEVTKIRVGNLGPEGVYRGTAVLSVSGHRGMENALKWAQSDTYDLTVSPGSGGRFNVVTGAKSLGLVTVQDFEIKLEKGVVTRLLYNRSGSAGPGGYIEARAIDIEWDGT